MKCTYPRVRVEQQIPLEDLVHRSISLGAATTATTASATKIVFTDPASGERHVIGHLVGVSPDLNLYPILNAVTKLLEYAEKNRVPSAPIAPKQENS